jgi:hypothetical protein
MDSVGFLTSAFSGVDFGPQQLLIRGSAAPSCNADALCATTPSLRNKVDPYNFPIRRDLGSEMWSKFQLRQIKMNQGANATFMDCFEYIFQ